MWYQTLFGDSLHIYGPRCLCCPGGFLSSFPIWFFPAESTFQISDIGLFWFFFHSPSPLAFFFPPCCYEQLEPSSLLFLFSVGVVPNHDIYIYPIHPSTASDRCPYINITYVYQSTNPHSIHPI